MQIRARLIILRLILLSNPRWSVENTCRLQSEHTSTNNVPGRKVEMKSTLTILVFLFILTRFRFIYIAIACKILHSTDAIFRSFLNQTLQPCLFSGKKKSIAYYRKWKNFIFRPCESFSRDSLTRARITRSNPQIFIHRFSVVFHLSVSL